MHEVVLLLNAILHKPEQIKNIRIYDSPTDDLNDEEYAEMHHISIAAEKSIKQMHERIKQYKARIESGD
jgi:hypothetical protein